MEQPADPPVAPKDLLQGTTPEGVAPVSEPEAAEDAAAASPAAGDEVPAVAPRGESVTLPDGGAAYTVGPPESGPTTAAVLVVHGQSGLDDRVKRYADLLADAGHLVVALDLYGESAADAGAAARWAAVDPAAAAARIQAGLQALRTPEDRKLGLLGWEAAGPLVLDAALAAPDLDAVVVQGVALDANPAALATLQAPILGLHGTQDPEMSAERLDALEAALAAAGKDAVIQRFDAKGAFTDPESPDHVAAQADAAWAATLAFLQARLGG